MMPKAAKCEVDDQIFEMQVQICKAFAHATRLRMLDLLAKRELTVSDLQAALKISTPNVSQHLAILKVPAWSPHAVRGSRFIVRSPCRK